MGHCGPLRREWWPEGPHYTFLLGPRDRDWLGVSRQLRTKAWNRQLYPEWTESQGPHCWRGRNLAISGRVWWEWGGERRGARTGLNVGWEDRKGKGIWGGEAKESQLTQLPFPGGQVSLKVSNDGPTLRGANASFSIALHFPESQKVLSDGQVIWANNTIINGGYHSTPGLIPRAQLMPFLLLLLFFKQIIYVLRLENTDKAQRKKKL